MKKIVKIFFVLVFFVCIGGLLNTENIYSKMKTYKEGKTYTLTGKVRGKHVKVRGKLYGQITAYYVVPIYIDMKSIKRI